MSFRATPYVAPVDPSRGALRMAAFVRGVVRVPGLRGLLLLPAIARAYGLCFIPLYIAAGADAHGNRFEVEAGLARGHYL